MALKIRNSIKIILLNEQDELLLMLVDDPKTTSVDGKYHGTFWCMIGGEIEEGETIEQAALREVYEETGIKKKELELGPIVWFGEFDLILAGELVHIKEKFIVARTKKQKIFLNNLTEWEKAVVKKLSWLSLDQMKKSKEIVFPVLLTKYLPDIIAGKYPEKQIEIDLAKSPEIGKL